MRRPDRMRRRKSARRLALVALGLGALLALVPAGLTARRWWRQAIELVELHRGYRVAHPGWSFPARVISSPVPLTEPKDRLLAEARARGYVEACPDPGPGQLCLRTGRVVPRRGEALEPVLLGWLIGPDAEIREHLPIAEAPRHLLDAIEVAEDRDFRRHFGVSPGAMLRAAFANTRDLGYSQGGSTLSMQVVRSLAGGREKTLERKLREMVMAVAIDRHLGKDGVLQLYLDAPYLGQRGGLSISGFQAASRHFFDKDARDLDLAEAATLAAILPAPRRFAPDSFPERARVRRDRVLRAMAELRGYEVTGALAQPVRTVGPWQLVQRYPAYLSAVRAWLEPRLPAQTLYGAGLVITAAVDVPMQEQTEALLARKTRFLESLVGPGAEPLQSAAVLIDVTDGRMRAIWGGFEASATGFNRATQARRQPGSAFKPLVYALAFDQPPGADGKPRFTAATVEPNQPRVFHTPAGDWSPRNVGGEYSPSCSLARGLAWSQNLATASLLADLGGPAPLIELAGKLGFEAARFPEEMGLALGQGEVTVLQMAQLAATIANGGLRVTGTPVLEATDAAGARRLGGPKVGERVLGEQAAALTRELMQRVVDSGTGGAVRGVGGEPGYPGPVLGKTGTTDHEKDAWFIGATPQYAAALWLGHDIPQPLGGSASDLAAPLWGWWLGALTAGERPLPAFEGGPRLTHRWICGVTGKLAGPGCQSIEAPFVPGTEPQDRCDEQPPEPTIESSAAPRHEGLWKRLERERLIAPAAGTTPAQGARPGAPGPGLGPPRTAEDEEPIGR